MEQIRGLVSVVIPTYNRAQLCRKAVESVLSQTYQNVEVIVVDDGSTDNTKECASIPDTRVRYVWQRNSGVSAARNLGLQSAKGEYIAFLDSDDTWIPWKLDLQLSVLRSLPSAGMVWTDMIAVDETDKELYPSYLALMYDSGYKHFDREKHLRSAGTIEGIWLDCPAKWVGRKYYSGNIFAWMFFGNLVHTSTVLLRRSTQGSVGLFDVSLERSGEDYDFHFRTSRVGDVAYIDVSTIRYRVGATDQLTSGDMMYWVARNNLKTVTKMLSSAKEEILLPESLIRKRLAQSYAWVGREELKRHDKNARWSLLESLKLDPFQTKVAVCYLLSFLPGQVFNWMRGIKRRLSRPPTAGQP